MGVFKILNFLLLFIPVRSVRRSLRRRLHGVLGYQADRRKARKLCKWSNEKQNDGSVISTGELLGKKFSFIDIFNVKDIMVPFGLREIFGKQEYKFLQRPDTVVIDIGMHVGIAALYFASRDDVTMVYGFEPVPQTYQKAVANFKINPNFAKKITPHDFGLGNSDKQAEVEFDERHSGSASMHPSVPKTGKQIEITVKNTADQIGKIFADHPNNPIVMKCDCEGAELEIYETLHKAQLLNRFAEIIMECHFDLDAEIIPLLDAADYSCRITPTDSSGVGIIRAIKQ